MLELVSVDGKPVERETATVAMPEPQPPMYGDARIEQLCEGQARIVSMLLAQQAELSRLTQALATMRVSRTQERSLNEAVRRRAAQLATQEGLPRAADKRIAAAIRVTLREATGARAMGDIQAAQFERAMSIIGTWRMEGALRRIKREVSAREPEGNP